MAATEAQIGQAIVDQVPEQHRMRVVRRMVFMVHPDKNDHRYAKEAFQKLNSLLKRKSSRWRSLLDSFIRCYMYFTTMLNLTVFAQQGQFV